MCFDCIQSCFVFATVSFGMMADMPFSYEEILAMVASSSRHSDTVKSSMKRKKPKYRCLVCRSHTSMRRLLCRLCNLERALPSCKPQGCWVHHEMACKDCLEEHWRNVSDILMSKFTIDSIVTYLHLFVNFDIIFALWRSEHYCYL